MWQLLCAKNRHAHAMRQCDRYGIQLGEDSLTTRRQPPMLQPMLGARCSHGGACTSCPLWIAVRGRGRGPASAQCIARKRLRHRRAGREIHRPCCCAYLVDAKAFGAPAGRMQHETCAIASEGPCGSCSVLKIGMPMP